MKILQSNGCDRSGFDLIEQEPAIQDGEQEPEECEGLFAFTMLTFPIPLAHTTLSCHSASLNSSWRGACVGWAFWKWKVHHRCIALSDSMIPIRVKSRLMEHPLRTSNSTGFGHRSVWFHRSPSSLPPQWRTMSAMRGLTQAWKR